MKDGTDTIGLVVTGEHHTLKLFFSTHSCEDGLCDILPELQCEIINERSYYYLLLKDIKWGNAYQIECNALCRAAEKIKLSYYFFHFDQRMLTTVENSNHNRPFFDNNVRKLFGIQRTIQFEDQRYQTFRQWVQAQFTKRALADLCNHGANRGFAGIIYYSETSALYEKYHQDIWEMLTDDCKEQGFKSVFEMLTYFNGADVQTNEQFKNLLVWYAVEKIAYDITQGEYPYDDEDSEISDDTADK